MEELYFKNSFQHVIQYCINILTSLGNHEDGLASYKESLFPLETALSLELQLKLCSAK